MHYKYPPVYKYIILLILITTFLKYYKVITVENYLLIASVFTYMVFIFDYVLIEEHPDLFYDGTDIFVFEKKVENKKIKKNKNDKKKKKELKNIKVIEDIKNKKDKEVIDNIYDSVEENDIDEIDKELNKYDDYLDNTDTDENLTEEIQRELDELDL